MILQPGRSTLVFLFLFGARRIDLSHVHPANPPSIEYALTELGCSLLEPVRALVKWTTTRQKAADEAREHFDREPQKRA